MAQSLHAITPPPVRLKTALHAAGGAEITVAGNVTPLRVDARFGLPEITATATVAHPAPDDPCEVTRWLVECCGFRL